MQNIFWEKSKLMCNTLNFKVKTWQKQFFKKPY